MRNKDIPLLLRLTPLRVEAEALRQAMEYCREAAYGITAKPATGMPRGSSVPAGFEKAMEAIESAEARYARALERCMQLVARAERVLGEIPDDRTRAFVMLRYVQGETPAMIRERMHLSHYAYKQLIKRVETAERMRLIGR